MSAERFAALMVAACAMLTLGGAGLGYLIRISARMGALIERLDGLAVRVGRLEEDRGHRRR